MATKCQMLRQNRLLLKGWMVQVGGATGIHPLPQWSRGPHLCATTQLHHIEHPALGEEEEETLFATNQVGFLSLSLAHTYTHTHTHHPHTYTHTHTHTPPTHIYTHTDIANQLVVGTCHACLPCHFLSHRLAEVLFSPVHWLRRLVPSACMHFIGAFTVQSYYYSRHSINT